MRKLALSVSVTAFAVLALAGCSVKQVDQAVTHSTAIPGTGNLYKFCDGTTLIYYSNYGSTANDEYEFIVYNGCTVDGPADPNDIQNLPDDDTK